MTPAEIKTKLDALMKAQNDAQRAFLAFVKVEAVAYAPRRVDDLIKFTDWTMRIRRVRLYVDFYGMLQWQYFGKRLRKDGTDGLRDASFIEPINESKA